MPSSLSFEQIEAAFDAGMNDRYSYTGGQEMENLLGGLLINEPAPVVKAVLAILARVKDGRRTVTFNVVAGTRAHAAIHAAKATNDFEKQLILARVYMKGWHNRSPVIYSGSVFCPGREDFTETTPSVWENFVDKLSKSQDGEFVFVYLEEMFERYSRRRDLDVLAYRVHVLGTTDSKEDGDRIAEEMRAGQFISNNLGSYDDTHPVFCCTKEEVEELERTRVGDIPVPTRHHI